MSSIRQLLLFISGCVFVSVSCSYAACANRDASASGQLTGPNDQALDFSGSAHPPSNEVAEGRIAESGTEGERWSTERNEDEPPLVRGTEGESEAGHDEGAYYLPREPCERLGDVCSIRWDAERTDCGDAPNSRAAILWIISAQFGFIDDPSIAGCRVSVPPFREKVMQWREAGCFVFDTATCEAEFWQSALACTGCDMRSDPYAPYVACGLLLEKFCDGTL